MSQIHTHLGNRFFFEVYNDEETVKVEISVKAGWVKFTVVAPDGRTIDTTDSRDGATAIAKAWLRGEIAH